jgi:IclR family mhp operon transcriptional activator
VNQHGGLRASQIAEIVGLPRPTAYRLLETLEGMGYLVRGPSDEKWRPTLHTRLLSSGYRDEDGMAQVAVPRMMKLGREILWPVDLVAFYDYKMVIRESTHRISPYSIDYGMVGRELPLAESSAGRAYLAFLPHEHRSHIIQRLCLDQGKLQIFHQEDGPLDDILERTRTLKVGFRMRGLNGRTMSISAPIYGKDRVLACLTVIWIASAITFERAVEIYKAPLLQTASSISDELSLTING